MNRVILMGRLTRDPDIRYAQGDNGTQIARYTLAVDRRRRRDENDGQPTADFIGCVAFGRSAEFAEKYLHKGTKILISGRIQTGRYTNRDGQTVYTTDVIVEDQEFAESKGSGGQTQAQPQAGNGFDNYPAEPAGGYGAPMQGGYGAPAGGYQAQPQQQGAQIPGQMGMTNDGFMSIPDGIDEELPFQ